MGWWVAGAVRERRDRDGDGVEVYDRAGTRVWSSFPISVAGCASSVRAGGDNTFFCRW